jgi:hypothetical protein
MAENTYENIRCFCAKYSPNTSMRLILSKIAKSRQISDKYPIHQVLYEYHYQVKYTVHIRNLVTAAESMIVQQNFEISEYLAVGESTHLLQNLEISDIRI